MALEQTLSLIKPDATKRDIIGKIITKVEDGGLRVVALKRVHWSRKEAQKFYAEHENKPFFNDLVEYMVSGPIIAQILEGENAIKKYRAIMGATNPEEAAEGTIRKEFAESLQANSVHGSANAEDAKREIAICFSRHEIVR